MTTVDLVVRLKAAIEAKAAKARAATPGPWFTPEPGDIAEWTVYGALSADRRRGWAILETRQFPRECMYNEASGLRMPAMVVEHANANAEHIADNDPADVLRGCDADMHMVQLHADQHECAGYGPRAYGFPYQGCDTLRLMAARYKIDGWPIDVDEHGEPLPTDEEDA
ncbi:MAG TPA: DUF6221 family protein [Pseudonocardiaceae bacterium]|jgi:hypothetical protein|nr:DUF6221 family protein [Pseudonocardiaceae bacterium]